MEFFFKPRGLALIGATPNQAKGGYSILKNLIIGFGRNIYPVNPHYKEIEGLTCYPSVDLVPDPVDLAIVFVPARLVPGVVRDCAARGIKGVMIESGGFAETGPQGRALQEELRALADRTGIRLWGPNCMGLVDARNKCVFSFVSPTIWEGVGLVPGDVSLVVQSGMLSAGFLIDTMSHGTMGVSKVCSIGNKVDVNEAELLEYLLDDPETKAVGMYLESIPQGRRFLEICDRAAKPIVVLKGGRSAQGAEAALSHTASLAGDGALISGLLAQAGVVEATDFKQMMDLARGLAAHPRPPAPAPGRVAVLTYSGGAGIVSADFMEGMNLELAPLSPATRERLQEIFPDWMPARNPVDLWPAIEQHGGQKAFLTAAEAVCADENVDAVLIHAFAGGFALTLDAGLLARIAHSSGKPMFCWLLGRSGEALKFHLSAQENGIPTFRELYRALECLSAVFSPCLQDRTSKPAPDTKQSPGQDRVVLDPKLSGTLDEYASKRLLARAGLPVVEEVLAGSGEEALEAARRFGFPVVMKGLAPDLVHKTEQGLVRLDIISEDQAGDVYSELQGLLPPQGRVLVQKQLKGGLELILGYVRDPQFGSCVMCGLGGVLAEVLAQVRGGVAFAAAPLSQAQAQALLDRLPAQELLNGFRGSVPANRELLARMLCNLGRLGADNPRIKEMDLNPVIIQEGRPWAVDASIILED